MMLIAVRVRNRQSKKCMHNLTILYLFSQRTFKQFSVLKKVQTDTMDVFKKAIKMDGKVQTDQYNIESFVMDL